MNLPLKLKSNKLFYSKWPYKVTCCIEGAHIIRRYKLHYLENNFLLNSNFIRGHKINLQDLRNFVNLSKEFIFDKNYKTRIQFSNIDFYLSTKDEVDHLLKKLEKYVTSITGPESEDDLNFLLEYRKYNICNKLPHGKYKFKIIFRDMPVSVRNNLISWAEKYNNDDIYIIKSTRNHFKSIKHHYGTHYFYVKDKSMIMMINMIASGYISKTEEFMVKSSINTGSN